MDGASRRAHVAHGLGGPREARPSVDQRHTQTLGEAQRRHGIRARHRIAPGAGARSQSTRLGAISVRCRKRLEHLGELRAGDRHGSLADDAELRQEARAGRVVDRCVHRCLGEQIAALELAEAALGLGELGGALVGRAAPSRPRPLRMWPSAMHACSWPRSQLCSRCAQRTGFRHLGRAQRERGAGLGHVEPAALLEQTAWQLAERRLGAVALREQVRRLHASVSPATLAGLDEQLRTSLEQALPAHAVASHCERERAEHHAGLGHASVALSLHETRRVIEQLGSCSTGPRASPRRRSSSPRRPARMRALGVAARAGRRPRLCPSRRAARPAGGRSGAPRARSRARAGARSAPGPRRSGRRRCGARPPCTPRQLLSDRPLRNSLGRRTRWAAQVMGARRGEEESLLRRSASDAAPDPTRPRSAARCARARDAGRSQRASKCGASLTRRRRPHPSRRP
jgi:hypothetical protein